MRITHLFNGIFYSCHADRPSIPFYRCLVVPTHNSLATHDGHPSLITENPGDKNPGNPGDCPVFTSAVAQSQAPRRTVVHAGSTSIAVTISGQGEPILFVPSRGRSVDDFDDLSKRLVGAGYQAILPEPRGIGGSTGPLDGITYHDLASDLAVTLESVVRRPATVIGHDFGGRIARTLASDHPRLVKQVVLIGAAGKVRRSPEMERLTTRFWETALPTEDRLAVLRQTFFAPGNDAGVWQDGWHFEVARAQRASDLRMSLDEWWAGGGADAGYLRCRG